MVWQWPIRPTGGADADGWCCAVGVGWFCCCRSAAVGLLLLTGDVIYFCG